VARFLSRLLVTPFSCYFGEASSIATGNRDRWSLSSDLRFWYAFNIETYWKVRIVARYVRFLDADAARNVLHFPMGLILESWIGEERLVWENIDDLNMGTVDSFLNSTTGQFRIWIGNHQWFFFSTHNLLNDLFYCLSTATIEAAFFDFRQKKEY